MRYLYLLLLTVFIASCANNRIRYSRVKARPIVVAEAELRSESKEAVVPQQEQQDIKQTASSGRETPLHSQESTATKDEETLLAKASEKPVSKKVIEEADEPSEANKAFAAMWAEEKAIKAKRAFITSFIMMVLPIVSLFFFIPFIIGWVLLAQSNNSRYITPFGEKQARIATILRNIILTLIILSILAIVIFFLIFW